MKKCPKCTDGVLNKVKLDQPRLELDKCMECQGVWFDEHELEILLAANAVAHFKIPDFVINNPKQLCPVCHQGLYECLYPGTEIMIDACKNGHGIWLDNNEWNDILNARNSQHHIECPKCKNKQPQADSCKQCGYLFNYKQKSSPESAVREYPTETPRVTDNRADSSSVLDFLQGKKVRAVNKLSILLFVLLFIFIFLEDYLRHGDKIKYGYISENSPFVFEIKQAEVPHSININTRSSEHRLEIHLYDPEGKPVLHHFEINSRDWDRDYFFTPQSSGSYKLELKLNELGFGASLIDVDVYQNDRRQFAKLMNWFRLF